MSYEDASRFGSTSPHELSPNEFFEFALENHKRWILEVKNPKLPCFMQFYMKEARKTVAIALAGTPKGHSPLDFARGIIEKFDPDYYIVLAECWCKQVSKDTKFDTSNLKYGDIEKMSDSYEILTAVGKSKDGTSEFFKSFSIVRNDKEEIIELKEQEQADSFETSKLP